MFAPPLYVVRKFPLKYLIDHDFKIRNIKDKKSVYYIKQQDNMLFRQIRLVTGNYNDYNPYFIFIDCHGWQSHEEALDEIILNGFYAEGKKFITSERSGSMTRNSILSFIDESIYEEINKRVSMNMVISKAVLSKLYAYKGLMLSSCHCLEDWYPKIIIVPDYYKTIKNQKIKYVYDKTIEFVDKKGNSRTWEQKDIAEKTTDIEINVFDGCGIHHPAISKIVKEKLSSKTDLTSILWRAPYIKGVTHEMDYESFFIERGISEVKDIWGVSHNVFEEPMIILTESMYKGKKYFQRDKTKKDWDNYWDKFKEYNHCIGIAKWNFSIDQEPIYTRANYQILQDLDLDYNDFASLAKDSIEWVEKILDEDLFYTYCFLGLFHDKYTPLNDYVKAILKNPEMLKEFTVRIYIINLLQKYINEFKCGKLWLHSCFKFLAPDLIMLLEHIGGIEPKGCLRSDEFFTFGADGIYEGEYLIERNPHICKSEHVLLNATNNDILSKYCSHLSNVCMINGDSITPQRLNGADHDGDLVLVLDNDTVKKGVNKNALPVIDIDDKTTSEEEEDTKDNRLKVTKRTMKNMIGENSNYATVYHNKTPKTEEQRQKYSNYIDLISVITGKSIDYAKTGVLFNVPRNIAKFGRPLPYFMKYASEYYGEQKCFSRSDSNMNRLCWEIEKWESKIRWKRTYKDFDWHIMIDESVEVDYNVFSQIELIFLDFCREMVNLQRDQYKFNNCEKYKNEIDDSIDISNYKNFTVDWQYYYNKYKSDCLKVCSDIKALANIAVILCYEKYPNKNKKFIWRIAGEGIVQNIKQVDIFLPEKCKDGTYEYLGKKYKISKINKEDVVID